MKRKAFVLLLAMSLLLCGCDEVGEFNFKSSDDIASQSQDGDVTLEESDEISEPYSEEETEPSNEEETEPDSEEETEPSSEEETEPSSEEETEPSSEEETEPSSEEETEPSSETETEPSSETETGPVPDVNSYRVIGDNGILVAGMENHMRGIMFYGGSYEKCDNYITQVKEFQAALPEVQVSSMVIPTSVDFYCPPEYENQTAVQKDTIDYIEKELKAAGINNIPVYDVLESHKAEDIYARTDHHWMPLGAYYAAKQYCDNMGLTISDLSQYRAEQCGGYVGSMYFYSSDENLKNDPEQYTVYYSPNEDKLTTKYYDRSFSNEREGNLFTCNDASSYYLSFLGSDDLIAHVKTDVKNGRRLVVIKESYGNGLIPFFTEAFEDIYVLDLRYCEVNAVKFCKDVDATDLLFANCAYTVAGGNCSYFEYIRTL